jgi:hypothetical protein
MVANNVSSGRDLKSGFAADGENNCEIQSSDFIDSAYHLDLNSGTEFGWETSKNFNSGLVIGKSKSIGQDEEEADCGGCSTSTFGNIRYRRVDDTTRLRSMNPQEKTDMSYEINRLDTYVTWPHDAKAESQLLARDGFKYSGVSDMVTCVFCLGRLRSWEKGDVPSLEHSKHYPTCRFVLGEHVGNVPIATDPRRSEGNQSNADREPNRKDLTALQSTAKVQQLLANKAIKSNNSNKVNTASNAAPCLTEVSNFPVEEREIKARMDTQRVRTVLEMRYPENLVESVLRHRLRTTGDDFTSLVAFIEALNAAQGRNSPKNQQKNVMQNLKIKSHKGKATTKSVGSQTATSNEQRNQGKTLNSTTKLAVDKTENRVQDFSRSNEQNKIAETATAAAANVSDKCHECHTNDINTAFLPCGHALMCLGCARLLTNCTLCGQNIGERFRIYLS